MKEKRKIEINKWRKIKLQMSYFIIVIYEFLKYIYVIFLIEQLKCLPFNILQRLNETTLIEKISGTERSRNFQKRNVPEKKRLLEME